MQNEKESELSSVPSKVFYQGEWGEGEKPIIIRFYNGTIELDQQNNSCILIQDDQIEAFIRSIRAGRKQANNLLNLK